MKRITNKLKGYKNTLILLPREILVVIYSYLTKLELLKVTQLCFRVKDISSEPSLWREIVL